MFDRQHSGCANSRPFGAASAEEVKISQTSPTLKKLDLSVYANTIQLDDLGKCLRCGGSAFDRLLIDAIDLIDIVDFVEGIYPIETDLIIHSIYLL